MASSAASALAVRPTPMRVADAGPVQSPYPTKQTRRSRTERLPLTSGMPAEVLVKTDERTFFDYITKPIRDSMSRAFNEH